MNILVFLINRPLLIFTLIINKVKAGRTLHNLLPDSEEDSIMRSAPQPAPPERVENTKRRRG